MKRPSLSNSSLRWTLGLALVGLALACPLVLYGESALDAVTAEVGKVFEKTAPAVVKIRSIDKLEPLAGTGFFIDSKGTILTSVSIIRDAYKAWVEYQKREIPALVVSRDFRSGVALLRIEAKNTPFLSLGNSDELKTASSIISVAYPYNLPAAPAFGIVSGFDVQYLNRFFATTHIRANIAVSPGQIGGPLLNSQGKVVGLMVMAIDEGKGCYALPSNSASKIIADIAKYGEAQHGWVGVGVMQEEAKAKQGGIVRVSQLFEGAPAVGSGITTGDRVLKIGQREISQPSDVLDAAFFSKVGEKVAVLVERDGKKVAFDMQVKKRPDQSRPVEATARPIFMPKNDEVVRVKGTAP
ncbi:MAG: S1C family serine protease [bacterium]